MSDGEPEPELPPQRRSRSRSPQQRRRWADWERRSVILTGVFEPEFSESRGPSRRSDREKWEAAFRTCGRVYEPVVTERSVRITFGAAADADSAVRDFDGMRLNGKLISVRLVTATTSAASSVSSDAAARS